MSDRPDPMTPAGCDLTDFAFMPLEVARLRDSGLAANETPEACWAAVLLWAASWHQIPAASMPKDDQWIAKAAGYGQRGRIDPAWKRVRDGAVRGWVECSDGRLYHPVVAEKAREAWQAKLKQRWITECGRIKKHNERHEGANVPRPTFEAWVAAGCPQGQALFVPGDNVGTSPGNPEEINSKRQGEGQRQGQGDMYSEPKGSGPALAAPAVDNSGSESDPEEAMKRAAKRRLWDEARDWLIANEVTSKDAFAFVNTIARDYPAIVEEALREAVKNKAPGDAKSWLSGIAQRMAGERLKAPPPVTVVSHAADATRSELDRRSAREPTLPNPEIAARLAAAKAALAAKASPTAEQIDAPA